MRQKVWAVVALVVALVLRMTKDGAANPAADQRREDAGKYARALEWLFVSQN